NSGCGSNAAPASQAKNFRRNFMLKYCFALLYSLIPALAMAADAAPKTGDYPNKPVRILLPTAAGGSLDTIARVAAKKLGSMWQQQPVIDNRAGAGGIIGVETAARGLPDGYTLLIVSTGNIATTPALYKNIPYDPVRDFSAVILMAETPYILVVHPSVAAK